MKILHRFYGCEEYSPRSAFVYIRPDNVLCVDCFIDNKSKKFITLEGKSEYYAEDTAENWILGVMNE